MNLQLLVNFEVLDWTIKLWVILVVFFVIAIIALVIYILALLKAKKAVFFNKKEISQDDFKKVTQFEALRDDFEVEIAKIKKTIRSNKK